ncbi:MAG: acyl-CoA thioesterase [Pseudanabaena sp.]|jgi:1,4-dihydroxy-2-naphthoyl-CoA hydrolase|nr:acyl-CoA thioesterase [Pseudanabaena sp. M090S1SP2A07QC]MCA6505058.1 acyl-CoA thioesterase [Pseudanabaena sp. M172S2SP2A07QC]MCA6510616.1 acyl-CoA thioesterase [Pseudanabaena sp. M109S1SP2A07QC]MCA6520562.1 acyl-CoA thioesterase [Pseudanabaena sp. M051S1SP2A07QC]MCA6525182.1 acyl-CoA thioesterase [Pseudanabaena sp. M179S2SP2A07QC]MCA6529383.1 acyl-CoA thioesterase [Pseudanabaena sp. M125S2SP2A07QC]MCA6535146.1 acyl-CoA thioesterase [Pseudanabaena sp. M176S2SP2A07QC]MCA6537437.1 acyl-CoA t
MNQAFIYDRTIHFRDTDAAGVVYFANGLSICHEAYETSLAASGIELKSFFRGGAIAVPITQASIDFFKPMFCGDRIVVSLVKTLLSPESFQIEYQLFFDIESVEKKAIAKALTKHVCIDPTTRKRCNLSPDLLKWIIS